MQPPQAAYTYGALRGMGSSRLDRMTYAMILFYSILISLCGGFCGVIAGLSFASAWPLWFFALVGSLLTSSFAFYAVSRRGNLVLR